MLRTLALCLLALAVPTSAWSTRFTPRWVTIDPLASRLDSARAFAPLPTYGLWGEYGVYTRSDIEHAYDIKLGGHVEMFRVRDDWSLAFVANTELVANNQDDLLFRPRATFWEEGFVLSKRWRARVWQLGYLHRCKHDVDNLETAPCEGGGCERSLIFGSVQGKLILPVALTSRSAGALVLRGDLFTTLQDDRIPDSVSDQTPNLERAIGSFGADFHARFPTRMSWLGAYLNGYTTMYVYGARDGFAGRFEELGSTRWNGGLAAGVALKGAAHLRFGLSYEHLSDTSINPTPESAHLVMFSMGIVSPLTMW